MRSPIPFHHSDISALAKSLRGALLSAEFDQLKHTDILNILARSKGFSNFQAFKANGISSTTSNMILLKALPGSFKELSAQAYSGNTTDRRNQPVKALLFKLNVSIVLGDQYADFVIQARASAQNWSSEVDYSASSSRVWQESLFELTRQLHNNQLRAFSYNSVNIQLPKISETDNILQSVYMQEVMLSSTVFSTVEYAVKQVAQATAECQSVLDWLRFIANSPAKAQQHKTAASQALDYLDGVARVSGDSYLNVWNAEKIANFRYHLTLWARGEGLDNNENEFQKLFPFKAPTAWIGTPPELDGALAKLILKQTSEFDRDH